MNKLPKDLVNKIIKSLHPRNAKSLRGTSKSMHKAVGKPVIKKTRRRNVNNNNKGLFNRLNFNSNVIWAPQYFYNKYGSVPLMFSHIIYRLKR